jgi:hypothetical protein
VPSLPDPASPDPGCRDSRSVYVIDNVVLNYVLSCKMALDTLPAPLPIEVCIMQANVVSKSGTAREPVATGGAGRRAELAKADPANTSSTNTSSTNTGTIILHRFGPFLGAPDSSPFVIKTMMLLKLAGLTYHDVPGNPLRAPKKLLPYIEDEGATVADSTLIRLHIERKYGFDFDAALSAEQKAAAWAVERMCEDHLYFAMLDARWRDPAAFRKGVGTMFGIVPAPLRPLAKVTLRRANAARLHGHGLGRHAKAPRHRCARRAYRRQDLSHGRQALWRRRLRLRHRHLDPDTAARRRAAGGDAQPRQSRRLSRLADPPILPRACRPLSAAKSDYRSWCGISRLSRAAKPAPLAPVIVPGVDGAAFGLFDGVLLSIH